MKKIVGLDLGTASIGWAAVNVAEKEGEKTEILACGSRVIPLSTDEKGNFEKGKAITTNADRRLKRSMRRNLQRRKQRRDNLKNLFVEEGWVSPSISFSENGKGSTHETLSLRAKSAQEEISLEEFARVLFSINGKRGYKSSRKTDSEDEGQIVDGMNVAIELEKNNLTPAEYVKKLMSTNKAVRVEFYRSDLEKEFNRIWQFQQAFYPQILTDELRREISHQGKTGTSKIFLSKYNIYTADNKGKDRRSVAIDWRVEALSNQLDKSVLAYVISDLRGAIQNSSGYLGDISNRSKELYFNHETVGQYLYRHIQEDSHYSTRNQVFYRQDYIDEFNRIWNVQSKFHPELSLDLKRRISDRILFYQRPLKSQKGLVSFCEFESHQIEVVIDGKKKTKLTGSRVAPRSSLLFQEFKIWQTINNIEIFDSTREEARVLTQEEKQLLADELTFKPAMKASEVLKTLALSNRRYGLNFKELGGNSTMATLFKGYFDIVEASGHGEFDLSKLHYQEAIQILKEILPVLGCPRDIIHFDSQLEKDAYEQQPVFKLWHLLYSYEGDNSPSGKEALYGRISDMTGLSRDYARILGSISFLDDYASISHKAISKILPYLKQGYKYDEACSLAGYNHSHSRTKEENDSRMLQDKLDQLKQGELRNPVVEKILNQMINVVNAISDTYGKPDEIHIELARELKQNARDREKTATDIDANNKRNQAITQILQKEFGIQSVRKTDILRYRLYEELRENGYKTLYSDKYIPRDRVFSKDVDIEHIIPQALLFDDSFSNKTLEFKDINIEKGRRTANDYVKDKYGEEGYTRYRLRVDDLSNRGVLSERKKKYLLMSESDIPSGFVDRDLRNSQYIARKAFELLDKYVRVVVATTGSVTARLREDWQLVDVMKELNFSKYEKVGRTTIVEDVDGRHIPKILDWTKRDDHRHHAMDAITIAFTKPEHIQILNNLNARSGRDAAFHQLFLKETTKNGTKSIFVPPMPLDVLRGEVKKHLDSALVSIKAKNKVVTKNINRTLSAAGVKKTVELTPRGALHKEQVYGQRKQYEVFEVPVNAKMDIDAIATVASPTIREALYRRLDSFGGDSQKAFSGKNTLEKNPIFLDLAHTSVVPQKVKCVRFKTFYSIRKDVAPDLSVEKVLDAKARSRIQERITAYNGDVRAALSNLEENPIWLDEEKTIPIKRVTIAENFNLCAIHNKRDKEGRILLDAKGYPIPNDFVNLRSNHHVALYLDENGKVQEMVVPLFEALNRINQGAPVVDRSFHSDRGWRFLYSMKVNEMFVFPDEECGFDPRDFNLCDEANAVEISPHLFRVQNLSRGDYYFRHHLETTIKEDKELREITWKRIKTPQVMLNVVKVRIDHLGRIVGVGEYD